MKLIENIENKLTLDGRKRVLEDGARLSSEHLIDKADPEAFTKEHLIEVILKRLNIEIQPEKHFIGMRGDTRKADYHLKTPKGKLFLGEAKPINADLFDKSPTGAVNQIIGLFRLAEVRDSYEFGIATDGMKWVFIDKKGKVVYQHTVIDGYDRIKEILVGKREVSSGKVEEEITKKFYDWYNALLHGGTYKDHNDKIKKISEKDCLVENILFVSDIDGREQLAQSIMDRLIFVKFLQSKGILKVDVLFYLAGLEETILNIRMKQLFFQVLNVEKENRYNIDKQFEDIPYLNGDLFTRSEIEISNPDYKIKALILKKVLEFLDSFKFLSEDGLDKHEALDPEILGYIFERAMTATDKKGTGAYYTPKAITRYISENTIYPALLNRINKYLKDEKGYKDIELIDEFDMIYKLRSTTLVEAYYNVILEFKVCDNACGSGAFLLAAASILAEIYKNIDDELRLGHSNAAIRKTILVNNLYGVDINPNAIEIAKLRLWLWLADSFDSESLEALPNIDFNLRVGNSLFGYVDISRFENQTLTLEDYFNPEESLQVLLVNRDTLLDTYKVSSGTESKALKEKIDAIDERISGLLSFHLYQDLSDRTKMTKAEFQEIKPLHWGFEFYDAFRDENGFDVIIGNPPYFKIFKDNVINKTEEYDEIKSGMMNSAAVFINRTLKLTSSDAYIGMIVPKMLAFTNSWDKIRYKLLSQYTMERVIDCGKAFKGVLLEQVVFTLGKASKSSPSHHIIVGDLTDDGIIETAKVKQKLCLDEDVIYLEPNQKAYSIKKVMESSGVRLGDISDIKLGLGIQGRKDVFIKDYKKGYHRVLRGGDVQRYHIRDSKFYNPTDSRLSKYRITIEQFRKPHIVAQRIVAHIRDHIKITAALDKEGLFAFNTVTNIFPKGQRYDLKYLLAILNSNAASYYAYKFIYSNAIRSMDFYKAYAKKIPLPGIAEEKQEEVVKIVEEIMKLYERFLEKEDILIEKEIERSEKKLNQLIYLHYGIKKSEREIIENSLK